MEGRKLTADEMAGAEEIAAPVARKLSADELAGAVDAAPVHDVHGGSTRPAAAKPDIFERLGAGLSRLGNAAVGAAGAAADTIKYQGGEMVRIADKPLDYAREVARAPGATLLPGIFGNRRAQTSQFVRGLDDMVTLGYGQQLADAAHRGIGDETREQQQMVQLGNAGAAPGYRELGNMAGMAVPGAANAIGKAGGGLVGAVTGKLAPTSLLGSSALGAARGAATYELAAPVTTGLSAGAAGHRLESATDVATDPAGLALAGTLGAGAGALTKVAERAPARVAARVEENITRGEAGGKTKLTAGKKVTKKAETGDLDETMQRHPDVYKALATKAASDPAKAEKVVRARLDDMQGEINPVYKAIDDGPAVPKAGDLHSKLLDLRVKLGDAGNTGMADVVEKFQNHVEKHYPTDNARLTASALRNMRNEVGEVAFAGDPNMNPKFRADAQRKIYGAINDTIEEAGRKTPGVDFDRLKILNKDTSTLLTVKDALADRASKAASGGTSAGNLLFGAMMGGGGYAHGGIKGALTGIATHEAIKAAKPLARGIDFSLAERTRQLGAPNLAAPVGARAAGLEYAAKVSEGVRNGLSLQQATAAADETP